MAKERYIDADKLIESIRSMPNPFMANNYYSGQANSLDSILNQAMQQAFTQYHMGIIFHLTTAINDAATLDGPCMLCRQRDGDFVPENTYCTSPKAG